MNYKIMIKQCDDPQKVEAIAAEIARWSGSAPDVARDALMRGAVCVRKEVEEDEARKIAAQFEGVGADVELVPLDNRAAAAAVATSAVAGGAGAAVDEDDDDEDAPGRILTDEEYLAALRARPDVFVIEKTSNTRNIQAVCLILAAAAGLFMSTRTVVEIATDFFEKLPEERTAKLVTQVDAELDKKKEEEKKEEVPTDRKQMQPTKSKGVSASSGGGDPRARVTAQGVLGIVSGQVKGKSVASADIFGKGGFATDIDAILSGVGGLQAGGDGGVGRKGVAGIGYGSGFGSGFGGGGGGIDNLLAGVGGGGGNLALKKRGELNIQERGPAGGMGLTGGRSMASIRRVVMQNMGALRHAYNRRLRENPGLSGTITIRFAINEFGEVTFATQVSSTIGDPELERIVLERVRSFVFERIDKPGDITEVTYPFAFTQ